MPLVDSHCHIDFPDFAGRMPELLSAMRTADVAAAVCVGVTQEAWPNLLALAEQYPQIFASVGVHPDHQEGSEPSVADLTALARHEKIIAIGETGLDYYRLTGDLEWQRDRFRRHIQAGIAANRPLIIHTRSAAEDTLQIMREEGAGRCGGVMHCFTESWDVAREAIDMGFHISFSGIVSFRNAEPLRDVVRRTPANRLLVETDSPYLTPTPFRGRTNQPAYVREVAMAVAAARGQSLEDIAAITTANFCQLFPSTRAIIEGHHAQ